MSRSYGVSSIRHSALPGVFRHIPGDDIRSPGKGPHDPLPRPIYVLSICRCPGRTACHQYVTAPSLAFSGTFPVMISARQERVRTILYPGLYTFFPALYIYPFSGLIYGDTVGRVRAGSGAGPGGESG